MIQISQLLNEKKKRGRIREDLVGRENKGVKKESKAKLSKIAKTTIE